VKDAISTRISEELHFSREDLSSFKGYKRAVMRIDNNYWRQIQDDKNKVRMARTLQHHLPKNPRTENYQGTPEERPKPSEHIPPNRSKVGNSLGLIQAPEPPSSNILGPDGCLTTLERNCQMNLGLCLHCG